MYNLYYFALAASPDSKNLQKVLASLSTEKLNIPYNFANESGRSRQSFFSFRMFGPQFGFIQRSRFSRVVGRGFTNYSCVVGRSSNGPLLFNYTQIVEFN